MASIFVSTLNPIKVGPIKRAFTEHLVSIGKITDELVEFTCVEVQPDETEYPSNSQIEKENKYRMDFACSVLEDKIGEYDYIVSIQSGFLINDDEDTSGNVLEDTLISVYNVKLDVCYILSAELNQMAKIPKDIYEKSQNLNIPVDYILAKQNQTETESWFEKYNEMGKTKSDVIYEILKQILESEKTSSVEQPTVLTKSDT